MKTKKDAKTTVASANLAKPSKPKHRCKRLLIVCGIVIVVTVVALISLAIIGGRHFGSSSNYRPNSPEDIMVRYLHDKYGKDFVLTGKIRRTPFGSSALWEHYYESDAHPVDDPRLRFKVKLDGDNKEHKFEKSDTYIEEGQILAEEDRLRPHIERIFGRDAEFGVEFWLCKKDGVDKRSFADLSQVMRICKEKTAGMTEDQILYANDGLDHGYHLYIYDPDGQSVKTNGDKARIVERLKEVAKYLPEGRPDSMWLRYYIKKGYEYSSGSEFVVSASDLSSDQDMDQLIGDLKPHGVHIPMCGPLPYPMKRGWHLDKKERTKKQSGCGNVSN